MGLFDSIFGKKKDAAPTPIRETLFGDLPLEQWPPGGAASDDFPWGVFVAARAALAAGQTEEAIAGWRRVVDQADLEPRHYLQAWHFLREAKQEPPPELAKQLLGVVIEVGMQEGLDLLAAYPDHAARYYNYSGAGVLWEHPDQSLDAPIDALLAAAREVVEKIGPWDQARPEPPLAGNIRLSFLTPSGLHFGQGPMNVLANDSLGGPVIELATNLMRALIEKQTGAA